jgi:hypothetical protein
MKNKIPKKIEKLIDKRMKELYKDIPFRLELEKEMKSIKSIDDLNQYQKLAESISRSENAIQKK